MKKLIRTENLAFLVRGKIFEYFNYSFLPLVATCLEAEFMKLGGKWPSWEWWMDTEKLLKTRAVPIYTPELEKL